MPTINLDNCVKCLKCVKDCPSDAIDIETGCISETCIHCGHCVSICPEDTISPDSGTFEKLVVANISATEFKNFTKNVRTHRNFKDEPISDETIQEMVEQMKYYSSASNARPIEIKVVKSANLIQLINDRTEQALINKLKRFTSPFFSILIKLFAPSFNVSALKRYRDNFIRKQKLNVNQVCFNAPVVMLFHGKKSKISMANADAYIWATETTLLASTLGIGTCFNGFIITAIKSDNYLKQKLGIPKNHVVHACLLMGYSKINYLNEVGREAPQLSII